MEDNKTNHNDNLLEDGDPFEWSIDEVASYLCCGSFHWARSRNPPRPDPATLDSIIRENDITGEVLLTDITKETLAQDLGIPSLGQRSTIFHAIQHLQRLSLKYKELEAQFAPASSTIASFPASTLGPCYTQSISSNVAGLPGSQWSPRSAAPAASPTASPVTPAYCPAETLNGLSEEKPNSVIGRRRSNEHMVIDSDGRKRRKLNLPTSSQPSASVQPSSQHTDSQDWYLGRRKLTAPDVFYDSNESGSDVFSIAHSRIPSGKRLFVKKQMQHYLRQPLKPVTRDGKKAFALLPYAQRAGLEIPQYFTLFAKSNGGTVMATKEDLSNWPELDERAEDTLPLYGESGSEEGFDLDTLQEIRAEEREKKKHEGEQKGLTMADLDDIIETCISGFTETWHTTRKTAAERKARKLWTLSRKNRSRDRDIRVATVLVARLEHRLKNLREEIKKFSWSKAAEVRQQCLCMEATVFDREHEKWKISILELDECPPYQNIPRKERRKAPRRDASLASDEEDLLDLESPSSEDVDDFIVPDEDQDENCVVRRPENPSLLPNTNPDRGRATPSQKQDTPGQPQNQATAAAVLPEQPCSEPNDTKHPPLRRFRKRKGLLASDVEVVDLTRSSGDESAEGGDKPSRTTSEANEIEIQTPPLNPVSDTAAISSQSTDKEHNEPPLAIELWPSSRDSFSQLCSQKGADDFSHVSWSYLEEREDRVQLLNKLVYSISDEERQSLRSLVALVRRKVWAKRTWKALRALPKLKKDLSFDYGKEDHQLFLRMATLYVSWVNCKKLNDKGIFKGLINKACNKKELHNFYPKLCTALQIPPKARKSSETKHSVSFMASNEDPQVLLDGSDCDSLVEEHLPSDVSTPRKKRKRPVKQSQEAIATQKTAQRRVEVQEQQQKQVSRKLEKMGVENDDPGRKAVSFDDPVIYLHPHLGGRVKPHQLEGIQFMWRELIKDEKRNGCLLAHTMGLGKTMQVISLLVTIADASHSSKPEIRNQIPESLRQSRTLVLCPSSLIDNWWEELEMWIPPGRSQDTIGKRRKVTPALSLSQRLHEISQWYMEGGVILLSYDLFKKVVLNRPTRNQPPPLSSEQHEIIEEQLLHGPNIIVADEAHKMKNRTTATAEACGRFKSKSRIALTGSPLANNLRDYFSMIDWIAPNYLGDFVQFKAKYVEPIEAGLYAESTKAERRESLKKLQVLTKDLDPKVNRQDIAALEGSLPPKVEFVITVPLTDLQGQAYKTYIQSLLPANGENSNTHIWNRLATLSLLCNHPACFLQKLQDRERPQTTQQQLSPPESDFEPTPVEPEPSSQVLPQESVIELQRMLEAVEDLQSPALSHRMRILENIIGESINAGDKILVFSHSLPTLDYIEKRLRKTNRSYCRLDGRTPIGARQDSTKTFNKVGSNMHVYLISTNAGGLGLNIFGANRVILFDFQFNPTCEEQAVGRAYRLGQIKPVFVYRFICGGTFEMVMHNQAVFKTQLSSEVVDNKRLMPWATKNPKKYVFPPSPVQQEDLSEYKGKDTVLDKVLAEENFIRNIELTETFQREDNVKLSAEEEKDVQAELELEQLKRNNPAEWARRARERDMLEQAKRARFQAWASQPPPYLASQPSTCPPFPGPPRPPPPSGPYPTTQMMGPPRPTQPYLATPMATQGPPRPFDATSQQWAPPSNEPPPSSAPPHMSFSVSNDERPTNGGITQNVAGTNE